jgi:hypothetical protein
MMPAIKPLVSGAFEAKEIPRQSGKATRNTTIDAFTSLKKAFIQILLQ